MSMVLGLLMMAVTVQYGSTAPNTEIPAECMPPKEDMNEIKKCCKLSDERVDDIRPVEKCTELVKNLPSNMSGTEKRKLKPDGFDCFDDCILVQLNLMGSDKKIDTAKLKASQKTVWANVTSNAVDKCSAMAANNTGICPSGADIFNGCVFRERYVNCPAELWTKSDACQRNLERLKKCPLSLPYNCEVSGLP